MMRGRRADALLLAVALLMAAGCAGGTPRIDQERVQRKLDLRLQLALQEEPIETLGEYIRVVVRLKEIPTRTDLDSLSVRGRILRSENRFVTMTIRTEDLPRLAVYKPVEVIELDLPNAPPPR